jgi:hypothetical protein
MTSSSESSKYEHLRIDHTPLIPPEPISCQSIDREAWPFDAHDRRSDCHSGDSHRVFRATSTLPDVA